MCKANFAATVKRTTPGRTGHAGDFPAQISAICYDDCRVWRHKRLDKVPIVGVIIFTAADAQNTRNRFQDSVASPERHAQSTTAGCSRRTVSRKGILRCPRSGSGQVRDAASSQPGRAFRQPNRCDFRILSSLLIPSSGRIGGERVGWPGPTEARSQTRPQAHAGSFGVCAPGASRQRQGDNI